MIKTPWPRFAKGKPFKKIKLPIEMQYDIKTAYNMCRFNRIVYAEKDWDDDYQAFVSDGTVSLLDSDKPFCLMSDISLDSFKKLDTLLRPLAEEWSGVELEFVNGYGVRSYVRDSILNVHRDNPASHIISAIIFVDEYPGKIKWPLDFVDHDKKHHQVTFEFGDMLLYESLCPHAREIPFPGEFYRNMYLHWKPKNWDPTPYSQNKLKYSSIQEALNEN
tara:strand:- start:253 stop:909 length:657 start_codon:yes stop_codon:yes gene_type:complete